MVKKSLKYINLGTLYENDDGEHYLLLSKDLEKDNYTIFNIKTNSVMITENIKVYPCLHISKLVETLFAMKDEIYYWLGLEYDRIKLLIDLKTWIIEIYNYEQDTWNILEEDNIIEVEDDIRIIKVDKTKFKIDTLNFKIEILTSRALKFKPYHNYILGRRNDYVFNMNNELELIPYIKFNENENVSD